MRFFWFILMVLWLVPELLHMLFFGEVSDIGLTIYYNALH